VGAGGAGGGGGGGWGGGGRRGGSGGWEAHESGLDKKTILLELSKALRHSRDRKVCF